MAADIIRTNPDSQAMTAKWKPLGDVALEQGEFDLAKSCFETSKVTRKICAQTCRVLLMWNVSNRVLKVFEVPCA